MIKGGRENAIAFFQGFFIINRTMPTTANIAASIKLKTVAGVVISNNEK